MTRGIVLFAVNNSKINYVQLAVVASKFIKHNMPGTDICLISDTASIQYWESSTGDQLSCHFTFVKKIPETFQERFSNSRQYRDTRYYKVQDSFRNESRPLVYELSPFDETLLLDADYLIMSDSLSAVWGNSEDFMINERATNLLHGALAPAEIRLNPLGIKMYWATAIYFKKCERAALLFSLVEHIKDNWAFYKLTYSLEGGLYRNDFAFSIALHILNGLVETPTSVASLPDDCILTALDTDQFFKIHSPSEVSFFANDQNESWKFYVSRIKGVNVHCMNKISLMNNMDSILKVLA